MPADLDPAIQSERIAFKEEDLVGCESCARANPPNRIKCIYCGAPLATDPEAVEFLAMRTLEMWESGTNVLLRGAGDTDAAADLLSLDREQLSSILTAEVALPSARVDPKAVKVVTTKLTHMGFEFRLVDDEELAIDRPPVRLAGMVYDDNGVTLVDFNTRARSLVAWEDLRLMVTGTLASAQIDSKEKRGLRKTTVAGETATSADEAIFDIYFGENQIGHRVHLAGFDYSCLGTEMGPLAVGNMSRLITVLKERSDAAVIDAYRRVRPLLTGIWDVESRKDPTGIEHVGFGKRHFGVVHSTNNADQFTRFSRLQRLML